MSDTGYTHFALQVRTPGYWRVTFEHPPINTITATTIEELADLIDKIEIDPNLKVVVFDSANPDYYLAHYDTEGDAARAVSMRPGPTGMHPWLDLTARLSRASVVSIAAIRGRARGAGSEFILACDLRFASRESTVLGQPEVGMGLIPGGGPMARLSRLMGRGRTLEVVLLGDDFDGPLAEQYGYVNRLFPDARLDDEVDAIAQRLASFERYAIAGIKRHVDEATLPADSDLPPGLADFFQTAGRPETIARVTRLASLGFNTDGDLERRLGRRVIESAPDRA
jgi:enoyl-CoA hydratase/carnithine racemase